MKQLLYKEFKIAIHPLYYLVALLSAFILIPSWVNFVALMYLFFILIPNVFGAGKANNDVIFSAMMPVRKRDVVGSRMLSIIVFELLQTAVAAICGVLNLYLYPNDSFLLDPNFSFFGFVFMMFALFNAIFFPMFYKTAYKTGVPAILATIAAIVFAAGVEMVVMFVPAVRTVLEAPQYIGAQVGVFAAGVVLFVLVNFATYRISAKRFERIDL